MKPSTLTPDPQATPIDRRTFVATAGAATAAVLGGSLPTVAATPTAGATPLRGTSALITGCSTGFGRLTAVSLARRGAAVVASMRELRGRNAPHAKSLEELAQSESLRIEIVEIDVDNDASVERGVARAVDHAGKIDVLMNNAGIIVAGPAELSMAGIRREFETNVFGSVRMLEAVVPHMHRAGSGLIVQVSSGLGRFVLPTAGGYCGTKFAVEAIMEAAAYELHPLGIEVAIVQPGRYETEFQANGRRYMAEARAAWTDAQRERAEAYAEHLTVLDNVMQPATTPPPQQVADAIVELVQTPAGQRPLRVPLAPEPPTQAGLQQINGALEQAQLGLLQGLGVGHWATLKQ